MSDFISFSGDFCPSHEDIRDIPLRDQLRALMPTILKPITAITLTGGTKKLEIELEKIDGFRPTFYVDIEERLSSTAGGIFRSLTMDEETGYVTDVAFDTFGLSSGEIDNRDTDPKTDISTDFEMDLTVTVTKERVDEIRQEIEDLFS